MAARVHPRTWLFLSGQYMTDPIYRKPPHNLDAEEALLGALLINNEAYDRVSGFLEPGHFFYELHRQIYETASKLIADGKQATPNAAYEAPVDFPPKEQIEEAE